MGNDFIKQNLNYKKIIRIIYNAVFLFIFMHFLSSNLNIIIFKRCISYIEYQLKYCKIESYLNLCSKKFQNKKNIHIKKNNPKISVISPLFNRERYLKRFLNSIRYQNFGDIEIILIDDYSTDNTVKLIKELIKYDKRIILLKNQKTKGTFISRNIGTLYSKGKYLILPDPDDIISKNILLISYKYAEKYFYEMIKFNLYIGYKQLHFENYSKNKGNSEIYQPELKMHLFYGNNELQVIDSNLTNKFIKRELYLRALNIMKNYYLNKYIIYMEDAMINFILYRTSKSLYFMKNIGYYYIKHSQSITNNELNISLLRIKFGFIYLKLLLEYSKNIKYEKDIINIIFNKLIKKIKIQKLFKYKNIDYNFYNNIINIFLNCKFISTENKKIVEDLKKI